MKYLHREEPLFYGWWIVGAFFITSVMVAGSMLLGFTAFFEPIVKEFGWSYTQVSLVASIRGIEVEDVSLALDVIRRVGPDGNYIMDEHTQQHFRSEHLIPRVVDRDKRDIWEKGGRKDMVLRARERAQKILANHREREIDPNRAKELDRYVEMVKKRSLDDFYAAEWES